MKVFRHGQFRPPLGVGGKQRVGWVNPTVPIEQRQHPRDLMMFSMPDAEDQFEVTQTIYITDSGSGSGNGG